MINFKEYAKLSQNSRSNVGRLATEISNDESYPDVGRKKEHENYVTENYSKKKSDGFYSLWRSFIKYREKLKKLSEKTQKNYQLPMTLIKRINDYQKENGFRYEVEAVIHLLEKGLNE